MKLAHLEVLFLNIIYVSNLLKTSRFVVADKQWPGGVVPFQFSEDSGKNDRAAVQFASLQYMYLSCINMVDMNLTVTTKLLSGIDHDGSITFEAGRKDCFAPVGFSNSKRSARCCNAETCLHEIGHILGLEHEHKREDRNYYIHLLFDNIEQRVITLVIVSDRPLPTTCGIPWSLSDNKSPQTSISRTAMLSIHDEQDSGFDFRSVMLYRPTAFSANGESIYRVLDPDQAYLLGIHNSLSYYDVKYVNNLYRCHETQCPTFLRKCRYDGFVLKIGDKCQCYCPPGLDPKRRCANIYKPGKLKARWPTGNYTLPMTGKTCPGEEWLPTYKDHCTPGFVDNSKAPHLNSRPQAFGLREKFCTMPNPIIKRKWRRRSSWESGSYCIVRNGECPLGFQSGFIEIRENHTDIKMTTSNQKSTMNRCEESGILNDYCCRQDGSALKPINLPSTLPFILMMSSIYESCQTVKDMQAYVEEIQYVNQVGYNVTAGGVHPFYYSWEYGISLKYCYYVPLVQDCGELVRLSRWKRSAILTSPNFPDIHENNLSCNWLIKTPLNSIIRLEFLEFSIDGSKDGCPDYVEVRLNMIGQPGVKYCGEFPVRVLLSSSNLMMVTLKTDYEKVKKGFKANVTVVMNSELCYDVEDNGSSYRGSMNITKDFDPCVPWTETTNCRHHAFNSRDETQGVGNHNFCRNPGHGLRPWCYTNASLCTRKYCDACGIAGSYDLIPNCKSLILQNDTFCSRNASAIKLCHSSCKLPFPQTFKNNTATSLYMVMEVSLSIPKSFGNKPIKEKTGTPIVSCTNKSIAFKRQKQKCESPKAINGDILYQTKRSYRVGDEVVVHCHPENLWQQNTSCLSNGQWDIGRVCGICPLHWTYSNGYCYRFFKERVNYAFAEKTCQDSHSVVVSPSGSSEFLFMLSLASTEGGVWLGLTFQGNSWLTSTGGKAQWTNWKPGQPDFKEGEEKCARFLTFDDNKWDDVPCDWLKFNAFICKLPAVRVARCEDASSGCGDFIREFPRFCEENHNFATQFCSKSCLLCQIKYAK